MWAHYAHEHRGYCLEFELDFTKIPEIMDESIDERITIINGIMNSDTNHESELLSWQLNDETGSCFIFTKINYLPEIPVFNMSDFLNKKDDPYQNTAYVVKHSIGVKGQAWKHENEFRLIANNNSKPREVTDRVNLLPIGSNSLVPWLKVTGIIIGMRMSSKVKEKVTALALKYKINLMSASKAPNS